MGPARDRWRAGRREEVTARDVWCHCGAVSATEQAPAQPRAVVAPRLRSLDVVRGLMLVVSVAVNSLVVTPGWFEHTEWEGVHGLDLVFPVFVTLTGCGLGFALHRRTRVAGLARRVLVLVAVGLLYNGLTSGEYDLSTWRIPGVLQLYAVVVALLVLGHVLTRTARGWFVITVVLAVAATAVLGWCATTCPGGVLTRECNPSGVVDVAVFGAPHVYGQGSAGHDPEGLLSILGATTSAAAGACLGHLLLAVRAREQRPVAAVGPVVAAACAFAALALLTSLVPGVVAMKRLWTPPFGLAVPAGVALVLLAAHLLLDSGRTPRAVTAAVWPLEALGRNSLLVYFGSHVLMAVLLRRDLLEGWDQWTLSIGLVLAWTALAAVLHRGRIYLRP